MWVGGMKSKWDIAGQYLEGKSLYDQILLQRGYQASDLNPSYQDLINPNKLSGMSRAVGRIWQAIIQKQKIVIYGDYDVDGVTATAVLSGILRELGADVSSYIPDRHQEGYGLNAEAIERLIKLDNQLLITVDCGITAESEISQYANRIDFIVTDHHALPSKLPDKAIAVIDPLIPSGYQFEYLAGVGVAYLLGLALIYDQEWSLRKEAKQQSWKPGIERWYLDLVAIGTICDIVPLIDQNRILVQYGLKVLNKTRRLGLKALIAKASFGDQQELGMIDESMVGFGIGPRINAAGRLEHADLSLKLIQSANLDQAEQIATELNNLNYQRKGLCDRIFDQAITRALEYPNDSVIVIADPEWSKSVVGIVASRVSEELGKPSIILEQSGDLLVGSARSIGNFNIIEAIREVDIRLKQRGIDSLPRKGGHAFAAGLSLISKELDNFRQEINHYAQEYQNDLVSSLKIDLSIPSEQISLENYRSLRELAPFGAKNPEPVFVTRLRLAQQRLVGNNKQHSQTVWTDPVDKRVFKAIAFNDTQPSLNPLWDYWVVYQMQENRFNGRTTIDLRILDFNPWVESDGLS